MLEIIYSVVLFSAIMVVLALLILWIRAWLVSMRSTTR